MIRCFFVQLNDKKSRWRNQKNGLPQGSVVTVQYLYYNDQPLPTDSSRFIYADDLCITTQQSDFQHVEHTRELALDEMSIYYSRDHLSLTRQIHTSAAFIYKGTAMPNANSMLHGMVWSLTTTVRTTALAVVVSTAEFACSSWDRSRT